MNNNDYSKLCKNSFDYAKNNLSREVKNKELEIFVNIMFKEYLIKEYDDDYYQRLEIAYERIFQEEIFK